LRAGTGCDPRTLTRNGYSALTARASAAELADARDALRWLAARFPRRPLLTVGHSEGTWHAARLAAEEEQVAGTVLLSAYRRALRQPVSPEVLALITAWATEHWGHPAR
jgi:pimeloyl-ACP methyl ester carboxylesterase